MPSERALAEAQELLPCTHAYCCNGDKRTLARCNNCRLTEPVAAALDRARAEGQEQHGLLHRTLTAIGEELDPAFTPGGSNSAAISCLQRLIQRKIREARAEALEEAAKCAENALPRSPMQSGHVADAIRALVNRHE